ncbi:MAG: zinc-dependent metalloprotease family protein, partial [Verrucomicrobiia bacterium]
MTTDPFTLVPRVMLRRTVTGFVFGFGFGRLVWQATVVAAAVLLPVAAAQPDGGKTVASRWQFTPGGWNRLDDIPQGRLRTRLERLSPAARENAKRWLQSFHFTAHDVASLTADREGGIYFTCRFNSEEVAELPSTNSVAVSAAGTSLPVAPFPSSLAFHSRPGAQNVLYLDFVSETVVNTLWNTELDRSSIPALPFSVDSDYETYNETEQTIIRNVWMRVAEDFAPFNIDVTTERPATLTTRTAVALITSHVDRDGQPNPESDAGGVAYVNVFGAFNYARYRPAWVYHDNLGNSESLIAEVVSHEIGHNLGLSHDGRTDGIEYYNGHGSGDISWGPIMGTGYARNVTQWSKGEYYNANNTQDDLAVIASKTTYKTDDHGNSAVTATPVKLTEKTNVVSTTPNIDPANANPSNKGVIEQSKDVDWFSFITGSGPVKLAVSPLVMPSGTRGGNLDLSIELYDSSGKQLLTNNPPATTSACLETNLPAGLYYIAVRNSGAGDPFSATPTGYTAYGSLGQYFLNGWVTDPSGVTTPPMAELEATELSRTGQTNHLFTVVYSDNVAVDVSTLDSSDIKVTGPNGYDRFAILVGVDLPTNGTPRRATYSVLPPNGGVWTAANNGIYAVWLEQQQVADTEGAWAPATRLGEFRVSIPIVFYSANMDTDPGWTMDALWQYGEPLYGTGGPRAGATGTRIVGYNLKGNYENSLRPRYATTPPINAAGSTTLSVRFQRWLRLRAGDTAFIEASTDGVAWVGVWTTSSRVQDS